MSYRRLIHQMLAASPTGVRLAEMREKTGASSDVLREALLSLRNAGIAKATSNGGSLSRWALVENIEIAREAALASRKSATLRRLNRSAERKRDRRAEKTSAFLRWAESDPVQRIVPVEQTTIQKRGPASVWELAA